MKEGRHRSSGRSNHTAELQKQAKKSSGWGKCGYTQRAALLFELK